MKRALVDRAKQAHQDGGGLTRTAQQPTPVEAASSPPPIKMPRVDSEAVSSSHRGLLSKSNPAVSSSSSTAAAAAASVVMTSMSPRPSTPRTPRVTSTSTSTSTPRPPPPDEEEEEGAFYLRHQNRALASELRANQRTIVWLETERRHRRQACQVATQRLSHLHAKWCQLEQLHQQQHHQQQQQQQRNVNSSVVPVSLSGASPSLLEGALTVPSPPPSTGSGEDVEHTKDLLMAVEQLASGAAPLDRWENMTQWSESLVQRAQALFPETSGAAAGSSSTCEPGDETTTTTTTEQPLSLLQSKCRELEARIQELATCRDEANASEHKVRRGLYRLATGRMTIDEVIKAVELDSDGNLLMEAEVEQNASSLTPAIKKEDHNHNDEHDDGATAEQTAELQKQVRTLEEVSKSRDGQITKLLEERDQWMKRMNDLLVVQRLSDDNNGGSVVEDADMIRQSRVYTETAAKVVTAERQIEQLQTLCDKLKQKWAESRGNEALLKEALKDLHEKHVKRWNELELSNTDNTSSSAGGESSSKETTTCSPNGIMNGSKKDAKQVVELEHELQQALETVRQAETIRTSLHEALKMNESLQSKLEELRAKNAALVAGKSASRASLSTGASGGGGGMTSSSAGAAATGTEHSHSHHHKEKVSSSTHSASTSERMQEKHRRMRKELMSAQLSKEAAKSKQDRAEKERDALLKTNARLLNQISEKDDMNAKSLSTILHLKSLAEQLTQEKEILDQKSKSSAQLALAARLAANAKERLEEEVLREKKISEETLEEREERIKAIQADVDLAESRVSQSVQKMVAMVKDLDVAKERCDELVSQSTEWEKDKKTLVESLAVARRETSQAKKRAVASSANGTSSHGESQFSVDQLNTHLSVLKSRLACPVCNDREKKCILLRCRHMFCRQCVDENIKNRSRKCPACATRFDTKDVGDVWL